MRFSRLLCDAAPHKNVCPGKICKRLTVGFSSHGKLNYLQHPHSDINKVQQSAGLYTVLRDGHPGEGVYSGFFDNMLSLLLFIVCCE